MNFDSDRLEWCVQHSAQLFWSDDRNHVMLAYFPLGQAGFADSELGLRADLPMHSPSCALADHGGDWRRAMRALVDAARAQS
jgi:hypothetical protein